MSRQSHLPPRCPLQKKPNNVYPAYDPVSSGWNLNKDIPLHPRHHRSVSQSYLKEEQPAWLDDLLVDPGSLSSSSMLRRSSSDSSTLLNDLVSLRSQNHLNTLDTSASCETDGTLKSDSMYGPNSPRGKGNLTFSENSIILVLSEYDRDKHFRNLDEESFSITRVAASCETDGMLKSDPMYGPNSPRGKGNPTYPENSIISAFSEYDRDKHFQNLDEESFSISRVAAPRLAEDSCSPTGEIMAETQALKRHPGQRSRVRKLQYIAELENAVDMLQQTESDLAARVASLLQIRLSLSVENNKLKQELIKLQQHKLYVEGQNQTLRKEFKMLKVNTGYGGKNSSLGISNASVLGSSGTSWQMLDMGKLNLS